MKHGFVIWTPLHLINCINLIENFLKDKHVHLFLYDDFQDSHTLISAVKEHYNHIHVYTIYPSSFGNRLQKLKRLFLNENPLFSEKLDHIYIPGDNYFARILYSNQFIQNGAVKIHYFEDGMGAYMNTTPLNEVNKIDTMQKKLNKYSIYHASWSSAYVYEPKLLQVNHHYKNIEVLPKLNSANPALQVIKKIFNTLVIKLNTCIQEPTVIFFDQPFKDDGTNIDIINVFETVEDICININLPLKVKIHPRSDSNKYGNAKRLKSSLPWEVYLLFNPKDEIIPVTINSTAAYSPYIMFNNNQPAISLIKYVQSYIGLISDQRTKDVIKNSINILERIQENSQGSFIVPENKEELFDSLNAIKSNKV